MMKTSPLVMVVDDSPNIAASIVYILESAGYRALAAHSALECVSKARRETPNLILMDVMMPGMDGSTAAAVMQETRELQGIPVVLLSAMAEEEVKQKAIESGAVGFLTKPFRRDGLLGAVRRWVGEAGSPSSVPVAS